MYRISGSDCSGRTRTANLVGMNHARYQFLYTALSQLAIFPYYCLSCPHVVASFPSASTASVPSVSAPFLPTKW